jgi:hypothetical protein
MFKTTKDFFYKDRQEELLGFVFFVTSEFSVAIPICFVFHHGGPAIE